MTIDEGFVIGDGIHVRLVRVNGNRVRIGIDAPDGVTILRDTLPAAAAIIERIEQQQSKPRVA